MFTDLIRLCPDCHRGVHMALYDWRELVVIVAKREGKTPQEIAVIIGVVL